MRSKTCAACRLAKPETDFSRQATSKDGRYAYCKACSKIRHRDAYLRRGKAVRATHKVCTWCKNDLPRESYRRDGAGKLHARCAACEDEIVVQEQAGNKRCNICYRWLTEDSFHPSKFRIPNAPCKACLKAQFSQPAYREKRRAYTLMKDYGLTIEQYDELEAKQGGLCPVCLEPLPPNRGGYVDHVHSGEHRGKIRAILHGICNRFVVWEHVDSAALRRAADLIDNPLTDWMVPGRPSSEVRKQARKQEKQK